MKRIELRTRTARYRDFSGPGRRAGVVPSPTAHPRTWTAQRLSALSGMLVAVATITAWWALSGPGAPTAAHPLHQRGPTEPGIVTVRVPVDADATVDSSRPDTPLGATQALTIGHAVGAGRATSRMLLHFALPTLPAASTIVSASLVLNTVAVQGQAEVAVWWSPINDAWVESGVTWSTQPSASLSNWVGYIGPDRRALVVDMTRLIDYWQDTGRPNHGLAFWVDEGECEAGRTRSYASREALPGAGTAAMLVIAYVGDGTPHPFPTPTPTDAPSSTAMPTHTATPTPTSTPRLTRTLTSTATTVPTWTPNATASLTPSATSTRRATPTASSTSTHTNTPTPTWTSTLRPSPTTTSTFGQWQGQASLIRPSEGARLAQPIDDEVWVFKWSQPNRGPCLYSGARLMLIPPMGAAITQQVPGLCHVFRADRPLAAGRWRWSVLARCAHGPATDSETGSFIVAEAPATPTPAPTSTPRPIFLPVVRRDPRSMLQADIVLLIDTSSSMTAHRLAATRAAVAGFFDLMNFERDQAALIAFNRGASVALRMTRDRAALERALAGLAVGQGTRLDLAIRAARDELLDIDRPGGPRRNWENAGVVILLTDGAHEGPATDVISEAFFTGNSGFRIYTIGLGPDADLGLLGRISDSDGSVAAPAEGDLAAAYRKIGARLLQAREGSP